MMLTKGSIGAEEGQRGELDGEVELRRGAAMADAASASIPAGEQRNRARGGAEEVRGDAAGLWTWRIEARRRGWPTGTPAMA